jgi:hypothetical protein
MALLQQARRVRAMNEMSIARATLLALQMYKKRKSETQTFTIEDVRAVYSDLID